jgi:hypothetical protein
MVRRPLLFALLCLWASPAHADGRVPEVAAKDLAVAGTCAPIAGAPLTYVTVGDTGLYRVDGRPEVLDDAGLVAVLTQRAAAPANGVSRHEVWVVASAAHPFLAVARVRLACQQARVFRMGVQVRAEQGGAVMGFPLFLPASANERPPTTGAPTARRLEVRLDRTDGPEESNPRRLFLATQQAVERFGPIVAEVSLDANLPTQHVITCLDMLYRGGAVGVKLGIRAPTVGRRSIEGGAERTRVPRLLLASVQGRALPLAEPVTALPPIAARKVPWPDEGANQPGALDLVLEDVPQRAGPSKDTPAKPADPEPLSSYAGRHEGAPGTVVVAANRAVGLWAQGLGKSLLEAIDGVATLPKYMVNRMREPQRLTAQVTPLQPMFKGAQRVQPTTMKLDVYLVRDVTIVGKVEVTLHTAGSALSFIFARWVVETFPSDLSLPPVLTDPFAAGVPGHVRVWLEAAFSAVYRQAAGGLPMAPEREVLGYLPAVAQAGAGQALAGRPAEFDVLAKWLTVTPYDRLLILPRQGTAAVIGGNRVMGILQYGLEAEEKELRLTSLTGRAAPR